MRTLVIGDLHFKQPLILPTVSQAIAEYGARRVVFCGDLCDEWGSTGEEAQAAMTCMREWVEAQRTEGLQVDILLGNHDFAYIARRPGPGTIGYMMHTLREALLALDPAMATMVDDILVTHAGVTKSWASSWLPGCTDAASTLCALEGLYANPSSWDALSSVGPERGGWNDAPSPLWADARELAADPMPDVRQIVGHTPHYTCVPICDDPAIWCCDTFSTFQDRRPIGDWSMLLVEDGRIRPVEG